MIAGVAAPPLVTPAPEPGVHGEAWRGLMNAFGNSLREPGHAGFALGRDDSLRCGTTDAKPAASIVTAIKANHRTVPEHHLAGVDLQNEIVVDEAAYRHRLTDVRRHDVRADIDVDAA